VKRAVIRASTSSGMSANDLNRAFVASLMGRVTTPGQFANWIAPPARGVNMQPIDFEYVRFD